MSHRETWLGLEQSAKPLVRAGMVLGWGIFNLVEGLLNHQLLGIHHVWPAGPGPTLLWDVAFLVWGVLFILGGYAIVRTDDAVSPDTQRAPGGIRGE